METKRIGDRTRFGRLEIIGRDKTRAGYVICKCDCGNVKSIRKVSLTKRNEPTRSCGCIQREKARKIGTSNIEDNSREQIERNIKHNTNIQVIYTDKVPKDNTSGYKGISWSKSRQRWEVYIQVHGRRINLGRYRDLDKAIQVRRDAEEKYFKPILDDVYEED